MKNQFLAFVAKLTPTSRKSRFIGLLLVLLVLGGVVASLAIFNAPNQMQATTTATAHVKKPAGQEATVAGESTTAPAQAQAAPATETPKSNANAAKPKTSNTPTTTPNPQGNTPAPNPTPAPTPQSNPCSIQYSAPETLSGDFTVTGITHITMPAGCDTVDLTIYAEAATNWLPAWGGFEWADGQTEKPLAPVVALLNYNSTETYNGASLTYQLHSRADAAPGVYEVAFYLSEADAVFSVSVTIQ